MNRIETTGIHHQHNFIYKGWLIEDEKDIIEYFAMIEPNFRKGVQSLLKTHVSPDRWDHLARADSFGNLLIHAINKCNISGGSILLTLGTALDQKIAMFKKYIILGKKIIVNDLGGFCFLEDTYNIVNEFQKKIEYYISKEPKYINLENDPILEDYTCEVLPNCSYILNTYSLSDKELKTILQEFKDKGGIGIWQYTTGSDIEQLHKFMNIGLEVGLTEFIFNFNAGIDDGLVDFINQYQYNTLIKKFEVKEIKK